MIVDPKKVWMCVEVEHPTTGIRAVHYVQVDKSFVDKEAMAASQEREAGYRVLGAWPWEGSDAPA